MKLAGILVVLVAVSAFACGDDDNQTGSSGTGETATRPTASRTASGPTASIEPASGRPGTEVVVTGGGWPAGATIRISAAAAGGARSEPYASATASNDGSFTARFRLDRGPTGEAIRVGRLNLVASSDRASVSLAFEVLPPGPGGPGGPG